MASKKETTQSSGIGICGLMFIVFLALKLAGIGTVATWSWWWVTAPLWAPAVLVLAIFGIGFALIVAVAK